MRASYLLHTLNLCAIMDRNEDGHQSVTNDVESVLSDLVDSGQLVPGHPCQRVIYCDSDGIWDQIMIDEDCRFIGFAPIVRHAPRIPRPDADLRALFAELLLAETSSDNGPV